MKISCSKIIVAGNHKSITRLQAKFKPLKSQAWSQGADSLQCMAMAGARMREGPTGGAYTGTIFLCHLEENIDVRNSHRRHFSGILHLFIAARLCVFGELASYCVCV